MKLPGSVITWSKSFTLVPTYECFNACTYCNFRKAPGKGCWLDLATARSSSRKQKNLGAIEALILSGEVHPKHKLRSKWIELICKVCEVVIEEGLLPHTNVGPLSYEEMRVISKLNVSMGLMVEQVSMRLKETVHRKAPSKDPDLRLRQLEQAGELRIPFTTGLLIGIGEDVHDREKTLRSIAVIHRRFGHIQECIIQPFSPGTRGRVPGSVAGNASLLELPAVVEMARDLLPDDVVIQVPPNLLMRGGFSGSKGLDIILECIERGARDLGGISPVDEVNPDYAFPDASTIGQMLNVLGHDLQVRLPIYEHHERWLADDPERSKLYGLVRSWRQSLEDIK